MILIDTQKEEFSKLRDIRVFGRISHDDRFNGNLLVIGLGGVGSRTVCNLKGMMVDDIIPEDNIHFLMVDSDIPEMEQTIEDSKEHVGFNALEVLSIYRPNIENILADGIKKNPVHPNLANWMDADFPDVTVTKDGAHGNRQIGRLMFSNAYEDIRMLLFDRLEEIHDKANGNWMDVIIVSSLSGGTGSGILGITALKLGAKHVFGTDLDENAITAVGENLASNGISSDRFHVLQGNIIDDKSVQDWAGYEKYDIVVANILADVIIMLVKEIPVHLKKGGYFITSGIINLKEEAVRAAFAASEELEVVEITYQGEWLSVTARKK
jgi:hypothetical protein